MFLVSSKPPWLFQTLPNHLYMNVYVYVHRVGRNKDSWDLGHSWGARVKDELNPLKVSSYKTKIYNPLRSKRSISASILPLQLLYSPFIFYTKKLPKTQTLRTSFNSAFSCFRRATSIRSCSILGFPAIFSWVEYLGKLWIISRYPLVMTNSLLLKISHRNSRFTYSKWWFSIATLNNQRVNVFHLKLWDDNEMIMGWSWDYRYKGPWHN